MNVFVQGLAKSAARRVSERDGSANEPSLEDDRRLGGREEACGNVPMQQFIQQVTGETFFHLDFFPVKSQLCRRRVT